MRELGRTWAALAALGAGVVHLGAASRTTPGVLAALVLLGATELCWAVLVLARRRTIVPRTALAVALVAPGIWAAAAAVGLATGLPDGTLLGASALDLAAGALLALRRRAPATALPRTAAYLVGLVVASAIVAVVTATSLASGLPATGTGGMGGMGM